MMNQNQKDLYALADMFSLSPSDKGKVSRNIYEKCMSEYNWNGWQFWKKDVVDPLMTDFSCKRIACDSYYQN